MYERSAIVLERYFDNLLGFDNECNLRDNFDNYCNLVSKLEKYQINYQKELAATQEFNKSLKKVKAIQIAQEKLYKKSVQLEYNRNLLFNNVEGKIEDTRKCIEKVEEDVAKNNEEMIIKKEELLEALTEYNEKRFELSKCKRYKKMAENDYDEILQESQTNFEGISQESVNAVKDFSKFNQEEEILEKLSENGKGEKIPFNEGIMENATNFSTEITKNLVSSYLTIYEKMEKLLADISEGTAKVELHKKYARNEKAKVDFLIAVKEYIVQFLDYERMTVIHGRKSHNRLMNEACENFSADVIQINNLFELLMREIANKATKKAYKELYNKSYLIDIQEKDEKFKKEKNRVNLNMATLVNTNYWRIEGIQNIYTIFYKNITEVFERDVAEFDLPKVEEDVQDEADVPEIIDEEEITIEAPKAKIPFAFEIVEDEENGEEKIKEEEYENFEDAIDDVIDEFNEETTDIDFDIFGEKYQEIDSSELTKNLETKKDNKKSKRKVSFQEDNLDGVEEDDLFKKNISDKIEDDYDIFGKNISDELDEEDDLFVNIKSTKRKKINDIEDFNLEKEETGNTVLRKLRKINNVKKKKNESNIW